MGIGNQLLTLTGVVVGGVMSFLATSLAERARWRRGQEVRWDERRLAAYVDYATAVKETVTIASRLAGSRGMTSSQEPLVMDDAGLAQMSAAEARRTALRETVRLLADEATALAARDMATCANQLEKLMRNGAEGDTATWAATYSQYAKARDTFVECARRSLGVDGPVIPSAFAIATSETQTRLE